MANSNIQSKICLTAFFWGKFNNYFSLWLHCCKCNPSIDFLLLTDDTTEYDYPSNVRRMLVSFEDIRKRVKKHFDFDINLEVPYQICDMVPAFGDIFSKELQEYDFWGHIDLDLIFGNIREFVPDNVLTKYDRVSWRGHFSLYKNTDAINRLYKMPLYEVELYKVIFNNTHNALFAFEEQEINTIFEKYGFKVYKALKFADLHPGRENFKMMHFSDSYQINNQNQVFEFIEGQLFRHYLVNGEVKTEEMMYVHFLRRPMRIDSDFLDKNKFLILPNYFTSAMRISPENIVKWSKERLRIFYYLDRLNFSFFRKRKIVQKDLKSFDATYSYLNRRPFEVIIDNEVDERF